MHMKKAIHTIRPIIQFAQKNMMYIFFFVLPMIIWLVPSFDRMEETHGFLYADGILRGNGILVGTKVDGVDRVAFLTCKHVVTTPYLPANVAYINGARDSYGLYLNSPGKAFQYICLSNINPRRWHLAKDDDADFAWIVLSDDEIQKISGPKGPAYVQLQKSIMSKNEGMLCLRDFLLAGVQEGSEVENTRLFSRVSGNQFDPISCRYFSLVAKIPFAEKILALVIQKRGTLLRMGHDITLHDYCAGEVCRRVSTFDIGCSIGCSGSPVFARDKNGSRKLLGLIVGGNRNFSHFQSLDFALTELRESLEKGRRLRQ